VGHVSLTRLGRYLAATLASGERAVLSYRSAADLWGLRPHGARQIEVTALRTTSKPNGILVHRTRILDPDHFASHESIPITTVARTLLDLADVVPMWDLTRAVDRAERLDLFDLAATEEVLCRARGRKGARALRKALSAWQPTHTRSELEDRFQELVRKGGLARPVVNVSLQGEQASYEVDCHWPDRGLVVQLDGFAYHRTRLDRERDASVDADLELRGYRVMRLTWGDVVAHGARTTRRLERALSSRRPLRS
jgi:very-short-patch-repair endonuclease